MNCLSMSNEDTLKYMSKYNLNLLLIDKMNNEEEMKFKALIKMRCYKISKRIESNSIYKCILFIDYEFVEYII